MFTRGADFKMSASVREEMCCVLEHSKTSSVIFVQRQFWTKFAKGAPHPHNITRWAKTVFLSSVLQLLVTTNVRSSPILGTLMIEAIGSPKTLVSYKSHTAAHPRGRHTS
jgi:hypothetical protein